MASLNRKMQIKELLNYPEFTTLFDRYLPGYRERECFRCVYGNRLSSFFTVSQALTGERLEQFYRELEGESYQYNAKKLSASASSNQPVNASKKPSITDVRNLKAKGYNTFVAVTAVNYFQALFAAEAGANVINVNDVALSRLLLGRPEGFDYSTTIEEMIMATKAVKNGSGDCLVIPSVPFGYYNTPADAVAAATRLMKETGADAVHMEGAPIECVKAVCEAGWPVLGHAGLNKYHFTSTGSHKSIGRTPEDAQQIVDYCKGLENAGAFCVVLEGIPTQLGKLITDTLEICTCGIGGGRFCNGQFLVTEDLMGYMPDFNPKFVKKYADMRTFFTEGIRSFVRDVTSGNFPDTEHSYGVKDESYLKYIK